MTTTTTTILHPAKFSSEVLEEIAQLIWEYGPVTKVIDPFAGTGRVHWLKVPFAVGIELEPEWTAMEPGNLVGNALHLPFPDQTFDSCITSPSYGNRFADSHNAQDGSRRRSYTHDLRASTGDPNRKLHPDNSGAMQWGDTYRDLHDRAWAETLRVLQPGSLIVLNVSNHFRTIRGVREEQYVTEWHLNWFLDHGCHVEDLRRVTTRRFREGANHDVRAEHENVLALRYVAPVLTPDTDTEETTDGEPYADARDLGTPDRPELHGQMDPGDGGLRT